jgi:hypothetical protein
MMKFHLALSDGKWIGGMQCHRVDLAEQLESLRPRATEWKQAIVATRIDKKGRGRVHVIEPESGGAQ